MAWQPDISRVTVGLALAALCAGTATAQMPCDDELIQAESDKPELVDRICRAADRATKIFAECGLGLTEPVTVRTEEEILGDCLGLFHCGKNLIEVLTPEAITRTVEPDGMYAHIPPTEMFESIVIHELTHALYDGTPCAAEFTDCFVTSEYLAYALQFDSLPESVRALWLEDFDPEETVRRDTIGLGMLLLDTDHFALSAWAHLNQRADRCSWIDGILEGTIVFDRPHP